MTRQVSYGWSVDTASSVDVHRVDYFEDRPATIHLTLCLILTSRGKQKAAIRGEGEPPKEGGQSFVSVETGVLRANTRAGWVRFWRCLHRHDGWEGHRWCR